MYEFSLYFTVSLLKTCIYSQQCVSCKFSISNSQDKVLVVSNEGEVRYSQHFPLLALPEFKEVKSQFSSLLFSIRFQEISYLCKLYQMKAHLFGCVDREIHLYGE